MRKTFLVIACISSFLLVAGVVGQTSDKAKAPQAAACPVMTDLSTAVKALDEAIAAVKGDEKDKALAALSNAKESLAKVDATCKAAMENCKAGKGTCPMGKNCPMGKATKAAASTFANVKCPIMGGAIDPAKVTPALTREFNGQKVAFCCGGCPAQWDKLSDKEKQAKLDAVKAPAPTTEPTDKVMKMQGGGGCGGCGM